MRMFDVERDWYYYEAQRVDREDRILKCAEYCIYYDMSLREIAENIGIGKTTVWEYLTQDLKHLDDNLFVQCKNRLRSHQKQQIHKRDSKGRFRK